MWLWGCDEPRRAWALQGDRPAGSVLTHTAKHKPAGGSTHWSSRKPLFSVDKKNAIQALRCLDPVLAGRLSTRHHQPRLLTHFHAWIGEHNPFLAVRDLIAITAISRH